jgi:hypothetical protein
MNMKIMSLVALVLATQAFADTPIQITVPAGGLLEQLFDGRIVQFSCAAPVTPIPTPTPTVHWICNETVSATTGEGAGLSVPAQGEGTSKFDAYNALVSDCNNRVAQYNSTQPYVLNQINSDSCGSITPSDAGLKCTSL